MKTGGISRRVKQRLPYDTEQMATAALQINAIRERVIEELGKARTLVAEETRRYASPHAEPRFNFNHYVYY